MQFVTDGDGIVSARPSSTEPKIKFYVSVNTPLSNAHDFPAKEKELDQLIADMKSDLLKE